jgi:arabinofuranosyltransferase
LTTVAFPASSTDSIESIGLARLSKMDLIIAIALAAATALFVAGHLSLPLSPMEDASMLLRYSQNLARGHGIVWNVGEHPVEGATDFLYMVLIGVVSRVTQVGVKAVAAALLFVSQVVSVVVLYVGLRRLYRAPVLMAAGFAVTLGFGLGYHYVNTGFSAPFYGLFALLTWYVGMTCVRDGVTWRRAILFAALGFVTGLIRPDGVILAGLMLCSTLYGVRGRRLPLVVSFGLIFAVCGGAYFAWRMHYFGLPLPIPFYAKHSGALRWANLKLSSRAMVEMLLPFLPLAGLGLRSRRGMRQLTVWLITIVPFTSVWILISLENNHFSRFQYVMVPLSLLSLGGLAAVWWREIESTRPREAETLKRPLVAVMALVFVFAVIYNMHLYLKPFSNVGAQELGLRLQPYAAKNYSMVMTEAGDLPFYSEWRAVDEGGLNDAFVARNHGLLTEAYIDRYQPEILMYRVWVLHRGVAELKAQMEGVVSPGINDKLSLNDAVMHNYAIKHGYVLAAIWGGTYCDYHVYWVKRDFADRDAIVSAIRDHPYYMQETGQLAYDFRDASVPSVPCMI